MTLKLQKEKYEAIKKDLAENPQVKQMDMAKKHFVADSTISRIKNSKNYDEYLHKYICSGAKIIHTAPKKVTKPVAEVETKTETKPEPKAVKKKNAKPTPKPKTSVKVKQEKKGFASFFKRLFR